MCGGYGITFDSASSWSFDNQIARNAMIFGADIVHHPISTITRIIFGTR